MNRYLELNNAVLSLYSLPSTSDKTNISILTKNTMNTWQPNRTFAEKRRDTEQGKKAENVFERYAQDVLSIKYISYDELRCDAFEKHAPCDGFILSQDTTESVLNELKTRLKEDTKNSLGYYVALSRSTKLFLKQENIGVVEIKSTKISNKKKAAASFSNYKDHSGVKRLVDEIRSNDDYLTYPHLIRSTTDLDSLIDYTTRYINYLIIEGIIPKDLSPVEQYKLFVEFERQEALPDYLVRIYVDEKANVAIIIGFIDKSHFYDNGLKVKRMPKTGKSEQAIYLSQNLSKGYCISKLSLPKDN